MITLKQDPETNIKKVLHAPTLKQYYIKEIKIQDKDHSQSTKLYLENYYQTFSV